MKKVMKAVAALMLSVAVVCANGCKKDDDSNGGNNGGGDQSHHEYVDLGLPSGTLWATCNVGAETPEGYGDYFAWAEVSPKNDYYDWNTYKYCAFDDHGDKKLTKYCSRSYDGYNGFTDNLTILQASDDAATVNWGSDWCMPNMEQWQELIDNTTSAWMTWNEVYGRVFYGNGQNLFLPAAGLHKNELNQVGTGGVYWSRTLQYNNSYSPWCIYFSNQYLELPVGSRELGYSVRPVRSVK